MTEDATHCLYCGAELPPRSRQHGKPRKWCDENCGAKGRNGQRYRLRVVQWRPPAKRDATHCQGCGDPLLPRARQTGQPRKWCREACARKHRTYRLTVVHWKPQPLRRWFAGYCRDCDEPFISKQPNSAFCSQTCANRLRERMKWRRRSARKTKGAHEHIDLKVVAIRDDWRCHLCQGQVTKDNWSLDHLVPLSREGEHTYANVALAHRLCNAIRGDMPLRETQLALIAVRTACDTKAAA